MRTLVPLLVGLVAVIAVPVTPVRAENRVTEASRPAAPTLPEPAPPLDWTAVWHADLEDIRSLVSGSPVRLRHERIEAKRRRRNKRRDSDAVVFRKTQRGAYDLIIADAAADWGLDPFLLKGLLITESRLDPKLVGKRIYRRRNGRLVAVGGGARGIAQFTTSGIEAVNEAREKRQRRGEFVQPFEPRQVWDPTIAIPAAAELLASYMKRFGRDGGITAYNSGPYGGRLVQKHGFFRAQRSGKLSKVRGTALQGHRFLINVLRRTNALRRAAGLWRLPGPDKGKSRKLDRLDRRKQQRKRGNTNT